MRSPHFVHCARSSECAPFLFSSFLSLPPQASARACGALSLFPPSLIFYSLNLSLLPFVSFLFKKKSDNAVKRIAQHAIRNICEAAAMRAHWRADRAQDREKKGASGASPAMAEKERGEGIGEGRREEGVGGRGIARREARTLESRQGESADREKERARSACPSMADKKEGEGEGKGGEGLRAQLPEKEGEQARAAGAHTYLKATTKGKKKKEGGNREGRGEIRRRGGEEERRRGGGGGGGGGGGAPQMRPVSALEDRSEEKWRSAQQARALT